MKRPVKFSRQSLYERVWSRSVLANAQEIGISATALMKICRRANIPVPPRGHWAKKQTGAVLPATPLTEPENNRVITVYFWPTAPSRKRLDQAQSDLV